MTKSRDLQDRILEKSEYTRKLFVAYFLLQVLVIVASNQISFVDVSVTQWLGNFAGLCMFAFAIMSRCRTVSRDIFVLAIVCFAGQMVPVAFYGEHLFDNLKSLGLNINIAATLLYFLVWSGAKKVHLSEEAVETVFRCILYASAVISVFTLIQDGDKLVYLLANVNAYGIDFSGVFPNKNMLGSFLAVGLMAGVYLLHLKGKKWFVLLLCAVVGFTLVCTLSRAAMLAAVAFLVVFLLRRAYASKRFMESQFVKKHGRRIRRLVIFAVLVCIVLYVFNDSVQQFVITKIIRSNAGVAGRDMIWRDLVAAFDDNILFHLFGMGYSELNFRSVKDCHNIYLYIYATGGLVKTGVYAVLLGKAFIGISKLKREKVALADFCFSAAIAYLVLGMFETNLLFELGLVSFEYALFILFIPAMCNAEERTNGSVIRCG